MVSPPPGGVEAAAAVAGARAAATQRSALALSVWRANTPELMCQLPSVVLSAEAPRGGGRERDSAARGIARVAATAAAPPSLPPPSPSSSSSEVWSMARVLEQRLRSYALLQVRAATPRGLVTAIGALRRARKQLRAGSDTDVIVSPYITTDHGQPTICLNVWRVRSSGGSGVAAAG